MSASDVAEGLRALAAKLDEADETADDETADDDDYRWIKCDVPLLGPRFIRHDTAEIMTQDSACGFYVEGLDEDGNSHGYNTNSIEIVDNPLLIDSSEES